jgi:DNA modification methylase
VTLTPYYSHAGIDLYHGEAFAVLQELPDACCQTCITSAPYWGLRDYGTAEWQGGLPDCDHVYNHGTQGATGQRADRTFTAQAVYKNKCRKCGAQRVDEQLGLEPTPEEYVERLVEVFREVRRVLRDDGTLWLNLGDSYNAHPGQRTVHDKAGTKQLTNRGSYEAASRNTRELKAKDLIGIPWRVAFAIQADGWYLHSDIIWAKPAPMPESVTDRPTRSHEYIFLLAKDERYFYNAEAIKEPSVAGHGSGNGYKRDSRLSYADKNGARGSDKPWRMSAEKVHGNVPGRDDGAAACNGPGQETRNKRDVWTIKTDPFPEAHFATFPPALILPCVLAGCPEGGTIIDPFSGAATTALVAKQNSRKCIGIELNRDYLDMSTRRLSQEILEFA